MKKMLEKRFMFLIALLVGLCVPMAAQTDDDTKSFKNESSNSNINNKTFDFPEGVISLVATTNGNNSNPRVDGNRSGYRYLRLRTNNMLTISADNGYEITKIEMTPNSTSNYLGGTKTVVAYDSSNKEVALDDDPSFVNNVFTINVSAGAEMVTMTITSEFRISQIKVTYAAKQTGPVDPTFTITAKIGNQTVTSRPVTLTVDGTAQLTLTTNSTGTKSYTSSNPNVITVDNSGKVTAVGSGEANITVAVAEVENKYNAKSETVAFKVNGKVDNNATLTAQKTTLLVGETSQLTFSTSFTTTKSYQSNKTSVATVDASSGLVKAVGVGSARITAIAAATTKYQEVTKTIDITVLNAATATVSAENATLAVGGTTQLNVTTNSNGAKTYTSSNNNVATVDANSGKVTAKGTGTATITVNIAATNTYAATSATYVITVIAGTATNGTVYYIQNAATGLFLTYGGEWGFFAVEGRSAHPMIINANGDYKSLSSAAGYLGSNELWMDRPAEESKWKFESTGTGVAGSTGQFYIKNEHGRVLVSQGNRYGQLSLRTPDDADSRHKWNLYTKEQLLALSASVDNPVDITAIINASSFDLADGQGFGTLPISTTSPFSTITNLDGKKRLVGSWNNYPYPYDNHNWHSMIRGGWGQPGVYNGIGMIKNTTNNVTITQNIGKLKKGTYYFSFQGFYRYLRVGALSGQSDRDMEVTVTIKYGSNNSKTFTLNRNTRIDIYDSNEDKYFDNYEEAAAALRDYTSYLQNAQFTLSADYNDATITITKPSTSSGDWLGRDFYNWTCFDNFALVYYGENVNSNTQVDFNDLYVSWLEKFIDEVVTRVQGFTEEAQDLFDISDVIANLGNIDNEAEYLEALEQIAKEFEEAYHHHHSDPGADVTDLIQNPDFEVKNNGNSMNENMAAPSWTGAKPKSRNGMTGGHASYYGLGTATAPITQTISVPNPGLYKLTAFVGGEAGSYTYLMANHYHKGVQIESNNKLQEVELEFMVTLDDVIAGGDRASIIIGVVAGSASIDDPNNYKYYGYGNTDAGYGIEQPAYGKLVRADHFRLQHVCDEANGYLKLALNEADAAIAKLDPSVQNAANRAISQYRTMYQTLSATGAGNAGKSASQSVFRALQSVVKTQNTEGSDFTYAILNNSFEMQYYPNWEEGWSFLYDKEGWGSPKVNQGNDWAYVTDDAGRSHYLMAWKGTPLAQHIEDIPNGDYELKVLLSSSNPTSSGTVYLTAQKYNSENVLEAPYGSTYETFDRGTFEYFKDVTLNFSVADNHVVVAVRGGNDDDNEDPSTQGSYADGGYWWYKADNFRLKYCGHKLTLDETGASLEGKKKDWYTTVTMNRTFKKPQESTGKATWNSFVAPFDIPASLLSEWEVKELISSEVNEDGTHISLTFDDPTDGIKAGVPYMVRNHNLTQDMKQWVFKNVNVDPTLRDKTTDHVRFVGVYKSGYIPEGAYYISNNKFYLAKGDKNTIKAYRAYLLPVNEEEVASVKSISFRIIGEGETDIEVVETEGGEAEVVAIYNLAGMRINELQPGVNILRMSDGTTETRIVK